ncbi:MAG: 4a-hydroxytetrahydrobiopterin dehydratase [Polyangiales bacterium]
MSLLDQRSVPLKEGTPKLDAARMAKLGVEVPEWKAQNDRLVRTFSFKNFVHAMKFVNKLAEIAEQEDHHPDFTVRYSKVEVSTWTHTVNGLSENDYILAAKLDRAFTTL